MSGQDDLLAAFAQSTADVLQKCGDRRSLHDYYNGASRLDRALWATAAELGWIGAGVEEAAGGLGLGAAGLDVLFRALGRAAAPGPFLPSLVGLQWLSQRQEPAARELVERIIAGGATLGIPASFASPATPVRGGILIGEAAPSLIDAEAEAALVLVESDGERGIALVPVGENVGRAGLLRAEPWDRTRAVARLACDGIAPLLYWGDAEGGAVDQLRRQYALALAADGVGAARAIADQTVAYLKERHQFGRALASFQALKHRVANLFVAIVNAEQILEQALEAEMASSRTATMWAALAKAEAADAFCLVADDCLQLHGGIGFTWEFDCHIFLKRALLNRELCEDSNAMRDRAAAALADAAVQGYSTAEIAA